MSGKKSKEPKLSKNSTNAVEKKILITSSKENLTIAEIGAKPSTVRPSEKFIYMDICGWTYILEEKKNDGGKCEKRNNFGAVDRPLQKAQESLFEKVGRENFKSTLFPSYRVITATVTARESNRSFTRKLLISEETDGAWNFVLLFFMSLKLVPIRENVWWFLRHFV